VYSLALAGDRVAWGIAGGGNSIQWSLSGTTLGAPRAGFVLGSGSATRASPRTSFVGDLAGSGSLLVFSSRDEKGYPIVTTRQTVHRVGTGGCPCSEIATEPGPLVPFDVDGGRVAAGGDNALLLLDASGTRLLAVFVRARAAQLSGPDLVVLAQGELRHYDAANGRLLRAWPLSDRATLQDAARGLAAYALDGQVHVLRLADGQDAVVAPGTLARFIDAGLVYADGPTIRLVRFDRLGFG
jgi:hypothetical protein